MLLRISGQEMLAKLKARHTTPKHQNAHNAITIHTVAHLTACMGRATPGYPMSNCAYNSPVCSTSLTDIRSAMPMVASMCHMGMLTPNMHVISTRPMRKVLLQNATHLA